MVRLPKCLVLLVMAVTGCAMGPVKTADLEVGELVCMDRSCSRGPHIESWYELHAFGQDAPTELNGIRVMIPEPGASADAYVYIKKTSTSDVFAVIAIKATPKYEQDKSQEESATERRITAETEAQTQKAQLAETNARAAKVVLDMVARDRITLIAKTRE